MRKTAFMLFLSFLLTPVLMAQPAQALSGTNADKVKVEMHAKQGGEWFIGITDKTDDDGVLKVKNVLPGKYRFEVDEDDQETGQLLAGTFRMLDEDGKRFDEEVDVDVYMYISGVKTLILQTETDEDGWIDLSSIYPDVDYYIDVRDEGHVSKKDGVRIKVRAKIEGSNYFQAYYTNLDEGNILKVKNVPSAKYKFKYKSGDTDPTTPFILKARLLDEDMEHIKEATKVELYVYQNGMRVMVGEVMTDADGWIMVPGMMSGMKYKIKVKD